MQQLTRVLKFIILGAALILFSATSYFFGSIKEKGSKGIVFLGVDTAQADDPFFDTGFDTGCTFFDTGTTSSCCGC